MRDVTGSDRPILFLDVDGVLSLSDSEDTHSPSGRVHWIDGVVHRFDDRAGAYVRRLTEHFEVVWATGWEEQANRHLPSILELPEPLPVITFDGRAVFGSADWKLDAMDAYAGDRPVAWIDDNLDETCRRWAHARHAPTLLMDADPVVGLTDEMVRLACQWRRRLTKLVPLPHSIALSS